MGDGGPFLEVFLDCVATRVVEFVAGLARSVRFGMASSCSAGCDQVSARLCDTGDFDRRGLEGPGGGVGYVVVER